MNYSTSVMLVNASIRAMKTIYEPDTGNIKQTGYAFKTLDPTLKVGDLVLVPTNTRFGFTVNKIIEADVDVDFDSNIEFKWIAAKVDLTDYENTLAMESEAIALIKKGELRKRRETIMQNTLDAVSAGAISNLRIAHVGEAPAIDALKE